MTINGNINPNRKAFIAIGLWQQITGVKEFHLIPNLKS
jgi:hypothetical protein